MVSGKKPPVYRPHPYTLYELNPGYVSADGLTHHNQHGFRGAAFDLHKPSDTFRIVTLGESTTYCSGIADDTKTFPVRLEAYLRDSGGRQRNVQVINAGVPGYTSIEVLMRYIFKVQLLDADLIVYYFTHNDVHPRRFPTMGRDYAEYSRPWCEPPKTVRQRIPWAYRMVAHGTDNWLAGHKAQDIGNVVRRYAEQPCRHSSNVLNNPSNIFHDNIRNLALLVKGWGTRMLIVTPPYRDIDPQSGVSVSENPVYRAVYDHVVAAQQIADELDFPCYQLARDMPYDNRQKPPNENFIDWVHFSEKGAEKVAGLMGRKILDLNLIA